MPLDLSALAARCAALPAGATVTVMLPRVEPERGAALVGQVQAGATVTVTGAAVGEYAPGANHRQTGLRPPHCICHNRTNRHLSRGERLCRRNAGSGAQSQQRSAEIGGGDLWRGQ